MTTASLDWPVWRLSRRARSALIWVATSVWASLAGAQTPAVPTPASDRHVVLISIDGLRPEFYLDARWPAPNLQALVQRGVYARGVDGIFPTLTYPSHTTLITGVRPARHGVFYNTRFDPTDGTPLWFVDAAEIKAPTLWDAVRGAGLKSASVSWPITNGAPIDYNLPEIWSYATPDDRTEAIRTHAQPPGLFEEVEANATGKLHAQDLHYRYPAMDANNSRILAYLIKTYRPNLAAIHLVIADNAQHQEGREGEGVRAAVAVVDQAVGVILDAVNQAGLARNTAVLVVGDHGFVDTHTALAPNVWLREAGLLGAGTRSSTYDRGQWKAVFHASGGATFLQLKDPNDRATLDRVHALLAARPLAERRLFRVIERDALARDGVDPRAALALAAQPGITFSADIDGPALKAARGGAHGYYPDFAEIRTGFIAAGAGVAPRGPIDRLHLEDVAPTAAALLGIALPSAEGVALPSVVAAPR
jgi:predicted AlkP superfamily pyrophosphatase or phosphodiesterase